MYLPLHKVADTPFHVQGDESYKARALNGLSEMHLFSWLVYMNQAVSEINTYMIQHDKARDLDGLISTLRYERVYLPLCKVADTPFHIQGVDL